MCWGPSGTPLSDHTTSEWLLFSGGAAAGGEKGPDARRRPKAGREAYLLYVERPDEGANEADGPFSAR